MNITSLMLAFLIHLQSNEKIDLCTAKKIQNNPSYKKFLIWNWADHHHWDLYVYMQDAIDKFIQIQQNNE